MATKEENIQRLHALAMQLGRAPDISGTAAEISQRLLEWEEEVASLSDIEGEEGGLPLVAVSTSDDGITGDTPTIVASTSDDGITEDTHPLASWAAVTAVRTIHIHAVAIESERELDLILAGEAARIPARFLDELLACGLVVEA